MRRCRTQTAFVPYPGRSYNAFYLKSEKSMKKDPIQFLKDAFFLKADDGLLLRCHRVLPPGWKAGGPLVLILTGRAECLDKYDRLTAMFLKKGVAVVRKDWRGQGGSGRMLKDGQKGHVTDFQLYLDDLNTVLTSLVYPMKPGKLVLLGHSMGSHLILRHLLEQPEGIHAAILESPMFSISTFPLPYAAARYIFRLAGQRSLAEAYIPGGGPFRPHAPFAGNRLTGDPEHFFRFQDFLRQHRQMQMGAPTLGWMDAADRSMEAMWKDLGSADLRTPLLILSGSEDRVVHPHDHEKATSYLPSAQFVSFKGARHELYMERQAIRIKVWKRMESFFEL
ncbi:lysophospholipase [Desulfobotulus alkaliphilus]|uniref:Lysophospholipase n=2 Tax=Desulfobotulus alkaliphilus TaxID=622671 RepID=A0A562RTV2_9BACT|nr:lysophospholipase [Desulfobotulus alkaliphilus]